MKDFGDLRCYPLENTSRTGHTYIQCKWNKVKILPSHFSFDKEKYKVKDDGCNWSLKHVEKVLNSHWVCSLVWLLWGYCFPCTFLIIYLIDTTMKSHSCCLFSLTRLCHHGRRNKRIFLCVSNAMTFVALYILNVANVRQHIRNWWMNRFKERFVGLLFPFMTEVYLWIEWLQVNVHIYYIRQCSLTYK